MFADSLCVGVLLSHLSRLYTALPLFSLSACMEPEDPRCESLVFSDLFWACILVLGMCMTFLIPWYLQKLLKALIPTFISSPNPSFPWLLGLFIACPNCRFMPQLLQPIPAPLNVFGRSHLGTCPSSGNAQSWAKQGQPLHQSLMGVARQVETHSHNFLTKMSVSLPSNLHQEYGLLFS